MTLLRAVARPMLASYFVISGVKAVKNPEPFVAAAEPVAERLVPLVKKLMPEAAGDKFPEDTATLVRLNGALQLAGGVALATGKGRRLGALLLAASLIPSTLARHPYWTRTDPDEKATDKTHFQKNVALMGGVLIASADTEGKPSIAWRASAGTSALAKDTKRAKKAALKSGHRMADVALAEGAHAVESLVRESRRARKSAAREVKHAAAVAERQAKSTKNAAKLQAKTAKLEAKLLAQSAKRGAQRSARNIHLGEN